MSKVDPLHKLKHNPTPGDYDSNRLKSKEPENAFTQVTAFWPFTVIGF